MLGINLLSIVKSEVLKYKDSKGAPVALDAIKEAEAGINVLTHFVSELTPADVEAILHLLPPSVLSKFGEGSLAEVATAVANLPTALAKVETELEKLQTELE